jgi:fatty-acid peroxygenase
MPTDALPRLAGDRSLELIGNAYRFIGRHADAFGTDGFRTRITARPITCIRGAGAARFFYEGGRFDRAGAIPVTVRHLLQDDGSVQTLSGAEHVTRKQQFLDVLDTAEQRDMTDVLESVWDRRAPARAAADAVDVREESVHVLGRTVLEWAGVPLDRDSPDTVTAELHAMVENAGRFGPRNALARKRRMLTEHRARRWIERARSGEVPADTVLGRVASWTDEEGRPLPVPIAAIELLNLLRPTVAVAEFLIYAALALTVRRGERERLLAEPDYGAAFANEVRRRAPFFPVIAGRAAGPQEWQGQAFPDRAWVMLDLYGTNHDPRIWALPERFLPQRFLDGADPLWVVAQGSGSFAPDHRCPGEPLTNRLVARFSQLLARDDWRTVGEPDAVVRYSRIPALPLKPLRLAFAA